MIDLSVKLKSPNYHSPFLANVEILTLLHANDTPLLTYIPVGLWPLLKSFYQLYWGGGGLEISSNV